MGRREFQRVQICCYHALIVLEEYRGQFMVTLLLRFGLRCRQLVFIFDEIVEVLGLASWCGRSFYADYHKRTKETQSSVPFPLRCGYSVFDRLVYVQII